jgi:pimeloyl-ACP methyl ester carboxylesterase
MNQAANNSVRTFGTLLALAVLLAVSGVSLPVWAATEDESPPVPAGTLVDAGGHKLHLYCTGEGSPVVILENGLGGTTKDWRKVQPEVSQFTRVCSYDRAGMGWSEAGPMPRTSARFVEELRTVLQNAAIPGPYVLAGHSLGGVYVRHFARLHPEEVAALVLVDGSHEDQIGRLPAPQRSREARGKELLGKAERAPEVSADPEQRPKRHFLAVRSEMLAFPTQSADDIRTAPPLPPLPLIVLVHGKSKTPGGLKIWNELQSEIASRSPHSKLIQAEDAGHYIQLDKPQLVIDSIHDLVMKVKEANSE